MEEGHSPKLWKIEQFSSEGKYYKYNNLEFLPLSFVWGQRRRGVIV